VLVGISNKDASFIQDNAMTNLAKLGSLIGLMVTIVPCLLYFQEAISLDAVKTATLIGTAIWFAFTPLWMGRTKRTVEE
jgi:uncharacterized protein (DUF486 family)